MTDNLDDFENQDIGGDGQTKPRGVVGNLAEAWRTRPLFKLMVVMITIGALVAVGSSFFGPTKQSDASISVIKPPDLHEAPGGPVSPYMSDQTKKADQNRVDKALDSGGSALPTPQGAAMDLDALAQKNDPLNELKTMTEKLKQQMVEVQQQQKQAQQQQVVMPQSVPPEKQDDTLSYAMQTEMGHLMDNWKVNGIVVRSGALAGGLSKDGFSTATTTATNTPATPATTAANAASLEPPKVLAPAGTVSYAQLLTEANSDVPGPIMAQIVSGPFSGARAIGQFKVEEDYLVLEFNLINYKGQDYSVSAYALDPNTTLAGMATDVDHRYVVRVLLPSAAAFLEGLGNTLGQTSQTVTTNGTTTIVSQADTGFNDGVYKGLGAAATTMSQFFQNQANLTKPLVVVAAGTPMGLFFISSVFDKATLPQTQPGQAYPGYPGGYPGTTMAGYGAPQMPGYGMANAGYGAAAPYPNANMPYANRSTTPYGTPTGAGGIVTQQGYGYPQTNYYGQ